MGDELLLDLLGDVLACRQVQVLAAHDGGVPLQPGVLGVVEAVQALGTPVAENGQIVVAMIDEEATVKRFYKEHGHFRLQPENDAYAPIIVDELVVLGRVKFVIRQYY